MSNISQFNVIFAELLKYQTVNDFWRLNNLAPRKEKWVGQVWRLADMSVGSFRACPRLRGIACVTDGVVLLVKGEGMNEIFNGHLDNWIIDVNDEVNISNQALQSKAQSCSIARDALINELIGDLM